MQFYLKKKILQTIRKYDWLIVDERHFQHYNVLDDVVEWSKSVRRKHSIYGNPAYWNWNKEKKKRHKSRLFGFLNLLKGSPSTNTT